MTTIAWDGRYLAADTLGVVGGNRSERPSCKIEASAGMAYATGNHWWAIRTALIEWCQLGHPIADYPNPRGLDGCLVVIEATTRRCWVFTHDAPYPDPEVAPNAWGTGGDVALGAMAHGATAMEAVQTAMRWDIKTGGHVDFVDMEWIDKGVQRWDGLMPTPVMGEQPITIHKPAAPAKSANGANLWADACTGRLVLGTGCGQCLRCNREWYALAREPHEIVEGDPGAMHVSAAGIKAALERAPLAVSPLQQTPPAVIPCDVGIIDIAAERHRALKAHVDAWNAASAVGDVHRTQELDIELRSLIFPPGVDLVIDNSGFKPRKRIDVTAPPQV